MIRHHLGHGSHKKERAVIHGTVPATMAAVRGSVNEGARPQVYT